ncbi:hypothetical protein GA0111570_11912 [Raineyella antarctica]|uniref:CAAX prenyl protease 2/Lysostaphin resistance protein A-like domain-containing protein n=1 Tax=Raineyella antarctica TaxID=1577474 RepID=A0A1G6IN17_9ACTN|nr:CPBP family intramembrane glutamic endopeptidase [Raineyella antarctica]SDC07898.1 hypothetical protein GA0111570_11912 [Raineyella antarctica]
MKRLYEKNEIRHFLVWLAIYLGLSIVVINIGAAVGLSEHTVVALPLLALAVVMLGYFRRTGIGPEIGLGTPPAVPAPRMWFYLPLLVLVGLPLVSGLHQDLTALAVVVIVLHYAAAGFLEEVLFRGLLLRALLKQGRPVWAVAISALTFGIGHVTSLLIGQSGQDTVLQIINATVVGLIFTLVVVATGSLTAVIVAHILYNIIATLSDVTEGTGIIVTGIVVLLVYGAWLLTGAGVLAQLRSPEAEVQPAVR